MRSVLPARRILSTILAAALAAALLTGPAAAATPAVISPAAAPADAPAAPAGVLSGIAKGLHGFDSLTVESQAQINCLAAAGYSYDMVNTNDLTNAEYNRAAAAGMKIVLFQGYYAPYWTSATNGISQGNKAVATAKKVLYPRGAQIYLNLENTLNTNRPVILAWLKNWVAAVRAAGYLAGVYVGADQSLTAADLDSFPGVSAYWRSASKSAVQLKRGYAQLQPQTEFEREDTCGHQIDGDYANTDARGVGLVGAAFPKALPVPTVAGAFAPLSPTRIVDTRNGTGAAGPVARGRTIDVQVTGRGGVPTSGAGAVVLNMTATSPTAGGYLSAFPTGAARAQVSSLNFIGRQTVANLVTVQLGAGGKVSLFNGSSGTVQILADVAGYYRSGVGSRPGTFAPVVPARLLDTRPAGVAALSKTAVATASRSPIPVGGYDAAVLNVTAVSPAAGGFLTVYAANLGSPPTASNLNFTAGRTVPNMATVPVDAAGKALIYNGSRGRTNLLADVAGYYRSGNRTDRGAFTPVTPARILDTRPTGKVAAKSAVALQVAGRGSVPAGSSAVVLNVTVVRAAGAGYLTVFPSDRSTPQASNINFVAGLDVANQVIVPIGADGKVVLLNSSAGATDLIADVAGYIRG